MAKRLPWLLKTIDAVDRYYGRHIVWRLALRGWQNKQRTTEEVQSRLSSGERLVVLFLVGAVMFVVLFVWQQDDGKPTVNWLALNFLRAVTGQHDLQLPAPEWRDLSPPLLALFGAPVALFLWYWRDVHTRATIENSRKDTNLKEFQEVQMRAAGALDEKLPAEARETLQVAAIHQLRGFIRGDYGEAFRRPAFELLRARLEHSAIERGDDELGRNLKDNSYRINAAQEIINIEESQQCINRLIEKQCLIFNEKSYHHCMMPLRMEDLLHYEHTFVKYKIQKEEHYLLIEEWNNIFDSSLPLRGINLSQVQFDPGTIFANCELQHVNLRGANLHKCHFQNSILWRGQLQGANFKCANLQKANLILAQLQGADLSGADLRGARLTQATLHGAQLSKAQMQGADLSVAYLQGARLYSAQLQGAYLRSAHLEGANLRSAGLQGANLCDADLKGALLPNAQLQGAKLTCSKLQGVDLRDASIDAATNLSAAVYDDTTMFGSILNKDPALAEAQKAQWRAQGARHVSER